MWPMLPGVTCEERSVSVHFPPGGEQCPGYVGPGVSRGELLTTLATPGRATTFFYPLAWHSVHSQDDDMLTDPRDVLS